jgi:hypothetical protein
LGTDIIVLTNKTMGWRFVLVNTRTADVLRATDPTGEPPDGGSQHVQRVHSRTPRDVATYAEELAEHKEREACLEEADQDKVEERPDDLPDDVPAKATITIKEINDNRYYYWQWREGEKVTSKYKGPVNPDE